MTYKENYGSWLGRFLKMKPPVSWGKIKKEILEEIEKEKLECGRTLPIEIANELYWPDLNEVVNLLIDRIKSDYQPDKVVGIETIGVGGGGIMADMIARGLEIPMDIISLRRIENIKGKCEYEVVETSLDVENEKVLLVDDLLFSGCTMKAAKDYL